MRLSERLQHWLARAELVARGGEPLRREALEALERGRPWEARSLALRLLEEVAESPVALAVWADAAEAMLLESEAREALGRLVQLLPYRADVWLRLGQAEARAGADPSESYRQALLAGEPREAALAALVPLIEQALDAGDLSAAQALARRVPADGPVPRALSRRLAELALALGDASQALRHLQGLAPELLDARGWVAWGQLALFEQGDLVKARLAFGRALLLGGPRVQRQVGELLRDRAGQSVLVDLLPLVKALDLGELPEWQVSIALAQGHPERALPSLERRARAERTLAAWQIWLDLALSARDAESLKRAVDCRPEGPLGRALQLRLTDAERVLSALDAHDRVRLDRLDEVGPAGEGWARDLRQRVYGEWLARGSERGWRLLCDELEQMATAKLNLALLNEAAELRADLERPLRVAVIGEFNAGKSSLINALLGQPVAPVGVLPTTATINRLRWAPDRFVRVDFLEPRRPSRVLEFGALKAFLDSEPSGAIASVSIFSPLEALRQVEVIDTPGFNAGQPEHEETALRAARRAHVLLWLLDASAPLKQSDAKQFAVLGLGAGEEQLPTLVVVNKCDRISASEVAEIMQHVTEGLAGLGVYPLTPPLAFSARLASHGDDTVQAASGLRDLKALFDDLLVRSVELKGRVLVQRARKLARELRAGEDDAAPLHAAAERMATRLVRGREAFEAEWAVPIGDCLRKLSRELVGVIGVDADLRGYAAERAASALGPVFFDLVSRTLVSGDGAEPDLVAAFGAPLTPLLEALARGVSLSVRNLQNDTGAAVARLLHLEIVRFLREHAVGGSEQRGSALHGAASLGAKGSSNTAAAQRERLLALESALGRTQPTRWQRVADAPAREPDGPVTTADANVNARGA
ncbi:MAG TPA: dynamin family protein [Polyangiaceae bacterium]|nr:dynamin family protein [Polyangiaceae bacterium]